MPSAELDLRSWSHVGKVDGGYGDVDGVGEVVLHVGETEKRVTGMGTLEPLRPILTTSDKQGENPHVVPAKQGKIG